MENKNEITLFSGAQAKTFNSFNVETVEDKKVLFNALENCDVLLNDVVGETIKIKDVYCEEKTVTDEETGEVKPKYRTIIFDMDGKTYATGAYGIYNVLKKLFTIYGLPTWVDGIEVKVVKKNNGKGKTSLSFEII